MSVLVQKPLDPVSKMQGVFGNRNLTLRIWWATKGNSHSLLRLGVSGTTLKRGLFMPGVAVFVSDLWLLEEALSAQMRIFH